uniref:Putative secreted peptide n=1 Tax=Hyalomma excavatum TaxID=257692 RepID=A0A131XB14_9ACAR
MSRPSAVRIALFAAVALLLITECLGSRPGAHGERRKRNCSLHTCMQRRGGRNPVGCPRGCRCSGLDRSNIFPKKGFCIRDRSSSSNPRGRS